MHDKHNTPSNVAQAAAEDTRRGERTNYAPADSRRLAYLLDVAKLIAEPTDQESEALARIAAGQGSPVELFNVQQLEGRKFIAILGARLHSLRHRYGFQIENLQERDGDNVRSWYYLKLNADGSPRMSPVPTLEAKTKPKSKAKGTQGQPATAKTARSQTGWRTPGRQFVISDRFAPVRIAPPSQADLFGRNEPRAAHWSDPDTQPRRAGGAR